MNHILDKLKSKGKRYVASKFNLTFGYIDDLISFNNSKFGQYIKLIYPRELEIKPTSPSEYESHYLDLTFTRDGDNNLSTKLYDKKDDFSFDIVNFPFMSSNIPASPAYGVYISQLIRYARCCSHYIDFASRHKTLVARLVSQGYQKNRLSNTFKKFYDRYDELVGKYRIKLSELLSHAGLSDPM